MSTGKSEPPYDPLPSSPNQPPPEYYVILPYHPSTTIRRQFRRYLTIATTLLLLLSAAVYFLYPSDPYLKVTNLTLTKFKIHVTPKISVDIELGVRIKIRNPDAYSLKYESLNVSVEYRGEELGVVTSDGGSVKAYGTSFIDASLVLNGVEVVKEVVFLVEDLVKGCIPVTTVSEVKGSLGVLLFDIPISAKLSCDVYMNTHNQTIERQDCYPA